MSQAEISEQVAAAINEALVGGHPLILAYTGLDERPHVSYRGSIQVDAPTRLSIWVRSAAGGFVDAIKAHTAVTLMYHNPESRQIYHLYGDARLEPDEGIREAVYAGMPGRERERDPERAGIVVLVDLERVTYGPQELAEPPAPQAEGGAGR